MNRTLSRASLLWLAAIAVGACLVRPAQATFHLWHIDEVYSNASGTVQYIDFVQPSFIIDDERFLTEANLADSFSGNTYSFPTNLPAAPVANQHFLVATPGYAALSGVPAPDYVLPTNDWFNPNGDTITYAGFVDSFTFSSGQLPTDGTHALFRAYGSTTMSVVADTATNFAGVSGAVPVPEPAAFGLVSFGIFMGLMRRPRSRRG